MARGYSYVEGQGQPRRPVPVLWKENAEVEKSFHADAIYDHPDGHQTVVEIEAGGAVANNLWRKDLMEACLMPLVDYVAICVRNEYQSASGVNRDYSTVFREIGAIYASDHWRLPLKGVLLVGY